MNRTKGVVAAGHEKTAEAAQIALEAGGNAFDAAVAALMASFVAEPCMSSAAGGGFMTALTATGKPLLFDFFCQTPQSKDKIGSIDFYPVDIHFGAVTEVFHIGKGSMAVPGNMAGVFEIHKHLGTLPLGILVEPAMVMAKEGIPVNNFQAYDFNLLEPIIAADPAAASIFYREKKIIKKGENFFMPNFADLLEELLHEGRRFYYEGEVAQSIVKASEAQGFLTMEDFTNYKVEHRAPLLIHHHGSKIFTNPPPSAGGALMALSLDMLGAQSTMAEHFSQKDLLGLLSILMEVEAIRSDSSRFRQWQDSLAQGITTGSNERSSNYGSTTHFSIMDEHGNALAITTTNGQGAGFIIPGTDIMMNNMLGEGALFPEGFHSWAPNTRVSSLMSPTILCQESGEPWAALGTGGAGRIPFSIMQVLRYLIDFNLSPEQAIAAPRVYWEKGVLNVEPQYEEMTSEPPGVEAIIRWDRPDMFFGGVHTIVKDGNNIRGIPDERREGVVLQVE